nr:MAG TPA: putative regulatory protein, FmdB family [Caudoviricetes sp.]
MKRIKLFGTPARLSLFGEPSRIQLFSSLTHRTPNTTGEGSDNRGNTESDFECTDCGHTWEVPGDYVIAPRCPMCGGTRTHRTNDRKWSDDPTSSPEEVGEAMFSEIQGELWGRYGSPVDLEDVLPGLSLPVRSVTLIRRAHGLVPPPGGCQGTDYLQDSGILQDLRYEHSGKTMPTDKFVQIIRTRYNDAPSNILDLLAGSGVIVVSGPRVAIQ